MACQVAQDALRTRSDCGDGFSHRVLFRQHSLGSGGRCNRSHSRREGVRPHRRQLASCQIEGVSGVPLESRSIESAGKPLRFLKVMDLVLCSSGALQLFSQRSQRRINNPEAFCVPKGLDGYATVVTNRRAWV